MWNAVLRFPLKEMFELIVQSWGHLCPDVYLLDAVSFNSCCPYNIWLYEPALPTAATWSKYGLESERELIEGFCLLDILWCLMYK